MYGGKESKATSAIRKAKRKAKKEARRKEKFIKWSGLTPAEAEKPYQSWSQTTKK